MRFADYEPYMTAEQREAKDRIEEIGRKMFRVKYEEDLEALYDEAKYLWEEYFPFFSEQQGERWYITRRYNDRLKKFHEKPAIITVNIFGNNVTVNVKGGDR